MDRNRDERYEQAMLLSRNLRALRLQPATHLSATEIDPSLKAKGHHMARGKVVVQPPKRPQMQPTRYADMENMQPTIKEPVVHSPVPTQAQQLSREASPSTKQKIDTEGPTGPLEPILQPDTEQQQHKQKSRKKKTAKQRPLWRKIFKSSR